ARNGNGFTRIRWRRSSRGSADDGNRFNSDGRSSRLDGPPDKANSQLDSRFRRRDWCDVRWTFIARRRRTRIWNFHHVIYRRRNGRRRCEIVQRCRGARRAAAAHHGFHFYRVDRRNRRAGAVSLSRPPARNSWKGESARCWNPNRTDYGFFEASLWSHYRRGNFASFGEQVIWSRNFDPHPALRATLSQ